MYFCLVTYTIVASNRCYVSIRGANHYVRINYDPRLVINRESMELVGIAVAMIASSRSKCQFERTSSPKLERWLIGLAKSVDTPRLGRENNEKRYRRRRSTMVTGKLHGITDSFRRSFSKLK